MEIFIQQISGKKTKFLAEASNTIANVKTKIQDEIGMPFQQQVLMFGGKTLEDGQTLSHYSIPKKETLRLIHRKPQG